MPIETVFYLKSV